MPADFRTSRTVALVLLVGAACLDPGAAPGQAEPSRKRADAAFLANLMTLAFQGTEIRLHNFGRQHGTSWHQPDGSSIRLGPALGGESLALELPEYRSQAARRRLLYYVDDVRSGEISAAIVNSWLRLSIAFESEGTEIVGRCLRKDLRGKWQKCLAGGHKAAPDVQLESARLELYLEVRAFEGSVSYGEVEVRFAADIEAGGVCKVEKWVPGDPCEALFGYRESIQAAVTDSFAAGLRNDVYRRYVAEALRPQLATLGIKAVRVACIEGDELVIEH